jgi:hypothetical protein
VKRGSKRGGLIFFFDFDFSILEFLQLHSTRRYLKIILFYLSSPPKVTRRGPSLCTVLEYRMLLPPSSSPGSVYRFPLETSLGGHKSSVWRHGG